MEIGDCPKCGKRTMAILGIEATEDFKLNGLCYNCLHTFEIPATIKRVKGDNKSNSKN